MPPPARLRLALLAFLLPGSASALSVSVVPIAFVGDAAPGVPGGSFASSFSSSRVNDAGQVAVSGSLIGGGSGVWTWDVAAGGATTPVLIPGPAPVGPAGAEISGALPREITPADASAGKRRCAPGPAAS